MSIISSPQNPVVKRIRSLAEKKYRVETGLFVAEGEKVLARAKTSGWQPETVLSTGAASPWGVNGLLTVTADVMTKVSAQKNPPALLATFAQRLAPRIEAKGIWLALEEMRDPGNLGTIIRTADAVGVSGVILVGTSCDPWGPDCVRATMGSIFAVPICQMVNGDFPALVRHWPGETVGTHLGASLDYRRTYSLPTLVVMGSEARGLSREVAEVCSTLVRIPMREGIESLNVAIAAGLMLYEVARLR
jgi:TrmH family RNA methyltransferase